MQNYPQFSDSDDKQAIEDFSNAVQSGDLAVVIVRDSRGVYMVRGFNCDTHEVISSIAIGQHIMLNAMMPLGNDVFLNDEQEVQ